jgi:CheY-like chemotaxis protein
MSDQKVADTTMLNGRPALIVEEEFLIALDIQRMLEGLGAGQTLFARNADEAHQLQAHWPDLALAIVETRSGDASSQHLHDKLTGAGIPVVLTSAETGLRSSVQGHFVSKPIPEDDLVRAVQQALASRG